MSDEESVSVGAEEKTEEEQEEVTDLSNRYVHHRSSFDGVLSVVCCLLSVFTLALPSLSLAFRRCA